MELGLCDRRDLSREPGRHRVARIAVLARPRFVDLLAEVLEDEPRAAARRLAERHDRVELRLVLGAALLVIEQVRAQVHGREVAAKALPFPAAMLAHESVPLEQSEDDACLPRRYTRLLG